MHKRGLKRRQKLTKARQSTVVSSTFEKTLIVSPSKLPDFFYIRCWHFENNSKSRKLRTQEILQTQGVKSHNRSENSRFWQNQKQFLPKICQKKPDLMTLKVPKLGTIALSFERKKKNCREISLNLGCPKVIYQYFHIFKRPLI